MMASLLKNHIPCAVYTVPLIDQTRGSLFSEDNDGISGKHKTNGKRVSRLRISTNVCISTPESHVTLEHVPCHHGVARPVEALG
jgi:hypothetical protein